MNNVRMIDEIVKKMGKRKFFLALAEWINTQSCHLTDEGKDNEREAWDDAENAILRIYAEIIAEEKPS